MAQLTHIRLRYRDLKSLAGTLEVMLSRPGPRLVYIAGPVRAASSVGQLANLHRMEVLAKHLMRHGLVPIVPTHLVICDDNDPVERVAALTATRYAMQTVQLYRGAMVVICEPDFTTESTGTLMELATWGTHNVVLLSNDAIDQREGT